MSNVPLDRVAPNICPSCFVGRMQIKERVQGNRNKTETYVQCDTCHWIPKDGLTVNPLVAIVEKVKCWLTIRKEPSCANCAHITTWYDGGNYWQPPDSGWDCSVLQHIPQWAKIGAPPERLYENAASEKEAQRIGCWGCPAYQFKDWEEVYRLEAEAEAQYYAEQEQQAHEYAALAEAHYRLYPDEPGNDFDYYDISV